ncbi:hypothetical protein SCOR_14325 [Sulfidibacter corallicola]
MVWGVDRCPSARRCQSLVGAFPEQLWMGNSYILKPGSCMVFQMISFMISVVPPPMGKSLESR